VFATDSQRSFSQREAQLQDNSDQYRAMSEDQIAELRKTCANMEHQLTTAREDIRSLQTTLSDKVRYSNTLYLLALK